MNSILSEIAVSKQAHIALQKERISEQSLLEVCLQRDPPRDFIGALECRVQRKETAIIAEIKKASPSRGVIRPGFDPVAIAGAYMEAGAACISILTDEPYFQGSDRYLEAARQTVSIPILRKDFMLDPYQIIEAKSLGADAILIILAMLDDAQAADLCAAAREQQLAILPEVHNRVELERALALDTRLIGINNRDLHTFETRLSTSLTLLPLIPEGRIVVSESGIRNRQDILKLQEAGIYGFLVGESLLRQPDPGEALTRILHE